MNKEERREYCLTKREAHQEEVEAARREDCRLRPKHQQAYLIHKDEQNMHFPSPSNQDYTSVMTANSARAEEFSHLDAVERMQAIDWALARGHVYGDIDMRAAAHEKYDQYNATTGEKIAFTISQKLDRFKLKDRKGSQCSDLDFADFAPPETLESCSQCGNPPEGAEYLVRGMCGRCRRQQLRMRGA